jgi:hypothetical protein
MANNESFIQERIDGEEIPNAPELGAAQPQVNADATFTGAQFTGAPDTSSLADFAKFYDAPSGISEAGRQFLNDMSEDLHNGVKNSRTPFWNNIEIVQLSQPNDTHAVICNNRAVIYIMAESNINNNDYPVIHSEKLAVEDLHRIKPEVVVLQVICISPDDYIRAKDFAAATRNLFVAAFNTNKINIQNLINTSISISDNPRDYELAYSRLCPHAVPLRHDLTATIYIQSKQPWQQNVNNMMQPEKNQYWLAAEQQARVPLAVIGGYVEYVRNNALLSGDIRYIPVIHITEINSSIVADEMLPIFLILGVKRFLLSNIWESYYRSNSIDVHGNRVNIGYLFPDGNGGRCDIKTDESFNQTMRAQFDPAQVVLDVVEGRFKLPGMWKLASNDPVVAQSLINDYMQFFNNAIAPYSGGQPYCISDSQYRGFYMYGNKVLDTAYIDYMAEYARHPEDVMKCEKLLLRKANPMLAIADQKQFEPDLKLLYRADVIALNPNFVSWLDTAMPCLNVAQNIQQTGIAPVTGVLANANAWGQYTARPQYAGWGTSNPFFPMDDVYRRF